MPMFESPLRYDLEVPSDGRIEVQLPLSGAGSHVTVYVFESDVDADDALAAIEALAEPVESDVPYKEFRRELGFDD